MYHAILQKALGYYGIKGTNSAWFRSYLTIHESDLRNTTCEVPHSSFFGPLHFLGYVNDLPSSSKILNLITFADNTNLFHDHKSIIKHFATVNEELLNTSKLSLDVGKTKYSLFHKLSRVDDLPLKLP